MVFVVLVSVAVGFAYGRLPHVVSQRVFASEAEPLMVRSDLRPELGVAGASRRAIATQVVMGALFGATAAVIGTSWVLVGYLWFVAVTATLTLTDVDRKLIPNRILFPSTAIAAVLLVAGALADGDFGFALVRAAGGALGYFVALFAIALLARGGFGMGDVKLGFLLGGLVAYHSWESLIVAGVGAFLLGGAVSLVLLVFRIKSRRDAIPFGPYLVIAAYIAIAAGAEIADWYRG